MTNSVGKLLTSEDDIKAEAIKHYKNVFKEREISKDLQDFQVTREKLCDERLNIVSRNKSPEWSISDVTNVLKSLKTGKSKDPYQLPNELFRPSVAGDDLILAVTKLMNRIKTELYFPSPMNICNVTNLYKNKGQNNPLIRIGGFFELQY